jgi:hypothetical protein
LSQRAKTVGEYLRELESNRKGKPSQVAEALSIYIDLWETAIKTGTVTREQEIGDALRKIEEAGGLYKLSEE